MALGDNTWRALGCGLTFILLLIILFEINFLAELESFGQETVDINSEQKTISENSKNSQISEGKPEHFAKQGNINFYSQMYDKFGKIPKKIQPTVLKSFEEKWIQKGEDLLKIEEGKYVYLYLKSPDDLSKLPANIEVTGFDGEVAVSKLSLPEIIQISELDFVETISEPIYAEPLFHGITQGVTVTMANNFHFVGITGNDVTVAVIDGSFFPSNIFIASNVISTNLFDSTNQCGGMMSCNVRSGRSHGTAVAEMVVPMAPDVNLRLYTVSNTVDFNTAVDHAIANGADIITTSISYPTAGGDGTSGLFRDGTSSIAKKINQAKAAGILTTIAAGNSAQRHWMGNYFASQTIPPAFLGISGAQSLLEFQPTADGNQRVCLPATIRAAKTLFATWSDWRMSNNDYDLYIFNSAMTNMLASSTNLQDGSQFPLETLSTRFFPGSVCIVIASSSSTQNHQFHIGVGKGNQIPAGQLVSSGSTEAPADSTGALTVGAVNQANDSLERFSSRGPTDDGRNKPEICGPDNTRSHQNLPSALRGLDPFFGTSAAAPHVAGAAALYLHAYPDLTVDELKQLLLDTAKFNAAYSLPNRCGVGHVKLSLPIADIDITQTASNLNPKPGETITITIKAENKGIAVKDLVIKARPDIRFVDFSSTDCTSSLVIIFLSVTCEFGDLANAQIKSVTFDVKILETIEKGKTIINTAIYDSSKPLDSTPLSDSIEIKVKEVDTGIIYFSANPIVAKVTDTIVYNMGISNFGEVDLQNVVYKIPWDPNLVFLGSPSGCNFIVNEVVCNFGTILKNSLTNFQFTAKPTSGSEGKSVRLEVTYDSSNPPAFKISKKESFMVVDTPPDAPNWIVNSDLPEGDGNILDGICDTGLGSEEDPYTGLCTLPAVQQQIRVIPGSHTIGFNTPLASGGVTFSGAALSDKITIDGGSDLNNPVRIEGRISAFGFAEFNVNNIWNRNGGIAVGFFGEVEKCKITNSYFTADANLIVDSNQGCEIFNNHFGFKPGGADESNFSQLITLSGNNKIVGNVIGNQDPIPGFDPTGNNCIIDGGMRISGDNNKINNNKIGTNPTGMLAKPNHIGLIIHGNNNEIFSNQISGNGHFPHGNISCSGVGILLAGDFNAVHSNLIGTDETGNAALPNTGAGITIGGNNNCIGAKFEMGNCITTILTVGNNANVISGNEHYGIFINLIESQNNIILNNIIGKAKDNLTLLGNGADGIAAFGNNHDIRDNSIVGNGGNGIWLLPGAEQITVRNNFIGTDGDIDLGNSFFGVRITDSRLNTIGGPPPSAGTTARLNNVISGNDFDGIRIEAPFSTGNKIFGNAIGTGKDLLTPIPNAFNGITIHQNSFGTEVGVDGLNVISGNGFNGIFIENSNGNKVQNNYIGLSGPQPIKTFVPKKIPNQMAGILITGTSQSNTIGGSGNFISGNMGDGIRIESGSEMNVVKQNQIGIFVLNDARSTRLPLGNSGDGILVEGNNNDIFPFNIVGDNDDGIVLAGNNNEAKQNSVGKIGSGNRNNGFVISGNDNQVIDNTVFSNQLFNGIKVDGGNNNQIILNEIGSNGVHGILVDNSAFLNFISNNKIGITKTKLGVGNGFDGIRVTGSSTDTSIFQNEISKNQRDGVRIDSALTIQNHIEQNSIYNNLQKGIENLNGGNLELAPPTVLSLPVPGMISGNTCSFCTVEIFSDSADEGKFFEGSTIANGGGEFSFSKFFQGPNVTCTATDGDDNTSEFGCDQVINPVGGTFDMLKVATDENGGSLLPGDVLVYQISVINGLELPIQDPVGSNELEDQIPANAQYIPESITVNGIDFDDDISDGIGFDSVNNKVIWNGDIPSLNVLILEFKVQIDFDIGVPLVSNQAFFFLNLLVVQSDDPDTVMIDDPTISNVDLANPDSDGDGIPDATDNCPTIFNPTQTNHDGDAMGDACDPNTEITTNTVAVDTTLGGDLTVDGATFTIPSGITVEFDFVNNKIIIKNPGGKILIEFDGKIT